jgi:hypothetical protein
MEVLAPALRAMPLLVLPVAAYFLAVLSGTAGLETTLMPVELPSGAVWTCTLADILVLFGVLMLFVEVLKATRASTASVIDHALSLFLFAACMVLFMVSPKAGTSTFFILLAMSMVDVIAGFTVTITAAKRDIAIERAVL